MNRNTNKQQNPFKKPRTSGNEIPLPTNDRLENIIFSLPISFPSAMMPARIPELYYKMKNKLYPDYFYFSILALGNKLCSSIRTNEDKNLESLYTKKAFFMLKQETDIKNPLYLWACLILLAHYGYVTDNIGHRTLVSMASSSVRVSKIYQLDLSRIEKMKYTEEELEFKRRVFWLFYNFDILKITFTGSFPTIQNRDIVVKLPTNDFWWRYGGKCKEDHPELMLWNNIANNINMDHHPKEKYKNLVKTILLHGKITLFARRRWIAKDYKPHKDFGQLIRLIDNLNDYSNNIVIPNQVNFQRIKETHEKYENTLRMTIDIESQILNYVFNQMYNSMKIVLYQSEIVRVKERHISPERIVSAKNIITECAEKQIDNLHNFNKTLPPNHSEDVASSWTLLSGVVFLNLMGIKPSGKKLNVPSKLKLLTDEYKNMGTRSGLFVVYPMFLKRLSNIIRKAHTENKKYRMIFNNMKKFSISKSDVNPWLVSKYGSYFTILCCLERSFSTLKVNEYLDIDESIISIINTALNSGIQNNTGNVISGKEHQNLLIENGNNTHDNNTHDIQILSRNLNTDVPSKTNYELYNKYSELLEKSLPNSAQNYLFQHMVDLYSSKIVKDVLNNPVNSQNNFGVSLGTYSIPAIPNNPGIQKSYKINYEIYIKYSQLLEKSHPKSTENHFFKHMVDSYLNKVINDILENPVNSRNNVETSFSITDTSYNSNGFRKGIEDERRYDI
ncbi:hypothetical protein BB559_003815 [Furculomyces boomerangus]|uniref:Xylanolytic transcriptional activator regulatory domain-containing protein n=1 Tax=Furculomyces boomerangus TaxID=61424 RepID=A0A2T9YIK2_9FUNG|nr:hypothetical protein BB559_003815 [Furculomyces boomerangus]